MINKFEYTYLWHGEIGCCYNDFYINTALHRSRAKQSSINILMHGLLDPDKIEDNEDRRNVKQTPQCLYVLCHISPLITVIIQCLLTD